MIFIVLTKNTVSSVAVSAYPNAVISIHTVQLEVEQTLAAWTIILILPQ